MKIGVYPGSFDPVTYGHIDIIERAAKMVDHLIIGVLNNSSKSPLFTVEEKVEMIKEAVKDLDNVEVTSFNGLLIDFARTSNAQVIIRGLRGTADLEYELQLAQANRSVCQTVDTIFLATDNKHSFVSSSIVRDAAKYGGEIKGFVPPCVVARLNEKFKK